MMMLLAVAAAVPIHFHFDATEFANAVYHMACVTQKLTCTRSVYLKFWEEKMHQTAADRAAFDDFRNIIQTAEDKAGPGRVTPFIPNDLTIFPGLKVRERLVAAAFDSRSPAEFRRRAAAIVKRKAAARLAAIVDHCERRLHAWWLATGQAIVNRELPGIERSFREQDVPQMAADMTGFLESPSQFPDYYVHVVPSPDYDGDEANGTMVANHFPVEINRRVHGGDFGWVAVHELTHSLYARAPQDRKDTLMGQFVESGDPSAHPFYLFMNEAMATAAQLVFCERYGIKLDEIYTHPYIPRLGVAMLPLLRTALAEHRTLYEGFAKPYLAAARAALGDDADSLLFRYSAAAVIAEPEIRDAFIERVGMRYYASDRDGWKLFARLDGFLMLRYDEVHFDDDAEMAGLEKSHRGFVYIRRNGEHDDIFMLGRDNAAVLELGKKWAETKERARAGLIFALD
jgi:hypothetical protein